MVGKRNQEVLVVLFLTFEVDIRFTLRLGMKTIIPGSKSGTSSWFATSNPQTTSSLVVVVVLDVGLIILLWYSGSNEWIEPGERQDTARLRAWIHLRVQCEDWTCGRNSTNPFQWESPNQLMTSRGKRMGKLIVVNWFTEDACTYRSIIGIHHDLRQADQLSCTIPAVTAVSEHRLSAID